MAFQLNDTVAIVIPYVDMRTGRKITKGSKGLIVDTIEDAIGPLFVVAFARSTVALRARTLKAA